MTRFLLAAIAAFMVAGACSGGGPAAPTPQAPTSAPATPVASAVATPTATAPAAATSAPTPSPASVATPASDLSGDMAALMPTEVGGIAMEITRVTVDMLHPLIEEPNMRNLVTFLGRSMDDLSMVQSMGASSQGERIGVGAIRVAGADGAALLQARVDYTEETLIDGAETEPVSLGGKNVIRVGPQDPSFGVSHDHFFYGVGDIVFEVRGDSEELIAEALSKLP